MPPEAVGGDRTWVQVAGDDVKNVPSHFTDCLSCEVFSAFLTLDGLVEPVQPSRGSWMIWWLVHHQEMS